MNINSLKFFLYITLLTFTGKNLLAVPLPFPPNISIKDIIKHGKRAIEKNKEDKSEQEDYQKNQEEFNKDVDKNKKDFEVINHKNELRKKFNGSWSGEFLLKDEDDLNISCKVEITIKNFNGYVNSVCKNIKYEVYLNINLERNLENSYILVFLQNKKLELNGDITSFSGQSNDLYVRGGLKKIK